MSDVFWCGAVGTVVLVRPAGQETLTGANRVQCSAILARVSPLFVNC